MTVAVAVAVGVDVAVVVAVAVGVGVGPIPGTRRFPSRLSGGQCYLTAREPDMVRAGVGGGREVAPRSNKGRAKRPGVAHRIINVHLVRWIGRSSAAAHDPHLLA